MKLSDIIREHQAVCSNCDGKSFKFINESTEEILYEESQVDGIVIEVICNDCDNFENMIIVE